jgi:hypothetical protein
METRLEQYDRLSKRAYLVQRRKSRSAHPDFPSKIRRILFRHSEENPSDTRKDSLDLVRHFCRGIGCPQTISGQSTGFSNGVDHENWTPLIAHSSQTAHTPSELREPFPTISGYAAPLWCKGKEIRNRSRCVRNTSYIWIVKSTAPCASVAGVRTSGAILRIALARQQPSVVHHILAPDPGGLPAF